MMSFNSAFFFTENTFKLQYAYVSAFVSFK